MMQGQVEPDWNAYSLLASIEGGRLAEGNPPVPVDLKQHYEQAWATVFPIALRDLEEAKDDLVDRGALAVIAHAKGQHTLAAIALCTEDERVEMLGR
jgi:hypothetical protein